MSDAGTPPVAPIPPPTKPSKTLKRFRLAVQSAAFFLFLATLLGTQQNLKTRLPHDFFFLADPLAGISAMIAGRSVIAPMLVGGLVLLAATLVLGRVWCGWLCPLGSLLDWIPGRMSIQEAADTPRYLRHGKSLALFLVLFGAFMGSLTLVVLDPVTLVFRSLASAILPLLNAVLLLIDGWLYSISVLQSPVGWFDSVVRARLFGDLGLHLPNLTLLAIFSAVLALNAVRRRFWCRYLCPLGGLLALISRLAVFRHRIDRDRCIACSRCAAGCHTAAIDPRAGYNADPAECTACLDCVGKCPTRAISFSSVNPLETGFVPEKRRFFKSVGLAAAGAVMLAFLPTPGRKDRALVRPPGSTEKSLAEKCIRCGECVKVCPSGSIQPAMSAANWDKTWAPHLVMRRGYCDYSCNACGRVCPTGAIAPLSLEQKRIEVIGLAGIDEDLCIPFAEDRDCIVCEEMCPLPEKAVILKSEPGHDAARPHVLRDVCTGCGICEQQCPVNGKAAIRVFAPGAIVDDAKEL